MYCTRPGNYEATLNIEFCNEDLNSPAGIAERCDFLDRFSKIVDFKLHFFLTNHSKEICISPAAYISHIVEGMQKIRSIEEDIRSAQKSVAESRTRTKSLKEKCGDSLAELCMLNRRKQNSRRISGLLWGSVKSSAEQYRTVLEDIREGKLSHAQEAFLRLRVQLEHQSRTEGKLNALDQLREKLPVILC